MLHSPDNCNVHVAAVMLPAAQKRFGKNGNLPTTGKRTQHDCLKVIDDELEGVLKRVVHENSHQHIPSMKQAYVAQQATSIKDLFSLQPHLKLQSMSLLAKSQTVVNLVNLFRQPTNNKEERLKLLSYLTSDFTLFFLNQYFTLEVSRRQWQKAHIHNKLFFDGGSSTNWESVKEGRSATYNVADVDTAFEFMTSSDQISHQASRTHYVTDKKGFMHELPAHIRRFNIDESYRLYELYCIVEQKQNISKQRLLF